MTSNAPSYIRVDAATCGGRAHVDGHRIRVLDIVAWTELQGYSPDEIVLLIYPQLSLAQVHAALSYYFDHRSEIQAQFAADDEIIRRVRAANPSKLMQRIGQGLGDGAGVPA